MRRSHRRATASLLGPHRFDALVRWVWLLNGILSIVHALLAFRLGHRRPLAPPLRAVGLAVTVLLLVWSFPATRSLPRSRQVLRTVRLGVFVLTELLEGRYPARRRLVQITRLAAQGGSTVAEARIARHWPR
jgi:hypothetical protein